MQKVSISKIVINNRIRKEYGNIQELASDIEENGLINPPVVTPQYELIAGERRIKACKELGWDEIEVRIMEVNDYENKLRMEISENENRKEFTFSERIEWAEKLEQIEKIKSENRQWQGKNMEESSNLVQNFAQGPKGRTRNKVAEKTGFGSGENYRKAKYIAKNAGEDLINKLDKEQISIHGAYKKLKNKNEKLQEENEDLEKKLDKIKEKKQNLDQKVKRLKLEIEDNNNDELEEKLAENKEKLNEKNKVIDELNSKLGSISKSKMKISTQKIDDICREVTKSNGQYLNEIKFLLKNNDINFEKTISTLKRWQDNLEDITTQIDNLIKNNLVEEGIIDV